jgi:hypothetical protein
VATVTALRVRPTESVGGGPAEPVIGFTCGKTVTIFAME